MHDYALWECNPEVRDLLQEQLPILANQESKGQSEDFVNRGQRLFTERVESESKLEAVGHSR